MKQFWFQILVLMIVAFVAMFFTFNPGTLNTLFPQFSGPIPTSQQTQQTNTANTQKIRIVDPLTKTVKTTVSIEVSDDKDERSRGLSFRDSLPEDQGMLFIFDKPDKYRFWMRRVKFPLDFIWINGDTIVDLLPNVPIPLPDTPDSVLPLYGPVVPINRVLEVNAGYIAKHGIKVGDKLELEQ